LPFWIAVFKIKHMFDARACNNPTIILGVDPGTASTGFGVIHQEGSRLILRSYGCIKTDLTLPIHQRLRQIYEELRGLISQYKPHTIALEQLFFNTNQKTATRVGEARGVILLAATHSNVEVAEYTPLEIKHSVVGYGRAQKQQVQYMVKTLLHMNESPQPDDAAYALAVAICHAHCRNNHSHN